MLNLNDLRLFVLAAEHGGFTAAARRLGLPKSTVSKRVAELEARLGARLIQRTSRRFALTELGRDVYDHARAAVIEAEAAESVVQSRLAEPSGTVRLTAAVPVAQFVLAPHLPALARRWPKLRLELHATDRFVDLVQERFDIAVRSHFAPLPESGLVQRRVGVEPVLVLAAPAYLERASVPEIPAELAGHDALLTGPAATVWQLFGASGEVRVTPRPRLVADESLVLLNAAESGLGIVCLPASICRAALDRGALRRILPGWTAGEVATTILMPHRRGQLPSVRAAVSFLVARLGDAASEPLDPGP